MSILYSMANVVPEQVQTLFAMLDIDGNNSIDFPEFDNLIQTLIQQTNIAQSADGNWQGIYPHQQLLTRITGNEPTFQMQNPGQLSLQEFYRILRIWLNYLGKIPPNTPFKLNDGGVIDGVPLIQQFKDLLTEMVNGTTKLKQLQKESPQASEAFDDCAICFSGMGGSDEIRTLNCKHRFHKDCIQEWYNYSAQMHNTCPTCRKQYSPGEIKGGRRRKTRRIKKARRKRKTRRKTHNKRGKNKSKSRKRKRTRKH